MKKYVIGLLFVILPFTCYPWGQTGHRTIGKIASKHLTKKARKALARIMGHESLAVASTWMDEVRSDADYNYMTSWHWVTIPDGQTYQVADKNEDGDIVATLERIINEMTNQRESLSIEKQREYIRILTHLTGDIHQPLHVGTGLDRGGNDTQVTWFWNSQTSLHYVWDTGIIDHKQFSYTELAEVVDHTMKSDIEKWQNAGILEWARESEELREQVYDIPEDNNLAYEYVYANWPVVQLRLQQAGIRLAGLLNRIFES